MPQLVNSKLNNSRRATPVRVCKSNDDHADGKKTAVKEKSVELAGNSLQNGLKTELVLDAPT